MTALFADTATRYGGRRPFAQAVACMAARPDAAIYYYSKYDRTAYRKLQQRLLDVCTPDTTEALFTPPRSIDLYFDSITKATKWPTRNYYIKTLAKNLSFRWRDADPSGVAPIEW